MLANMLGKEAQTVALWGSGGQPKISDRFIGAIYSKQQDGNAHIIQTIKRQSDSDLAEGDERLTPQHDVRGRKLAG